MLSTGLHFASESTPDLPPSGLLSPTASGRAESMRPKPPSRPRRWRSIQPRWWCMAGFTRALQQRRGRMASTRAASGPACAEAQSSYRYNDRPLTRPDRRHRAPSPRRDAARGEAHSAAIDAVGGRAGDAGGEAGGMVRVGGSVAGSEQGMNPNQLINTIARAAIWNLMRRAPTIVLLAIVVGAFLLAGHR
jgi:hypothetical protein